MPAQIIELHIERVRQHIRQAVIAAAHAAQASEPVVRAQFAGALRQWLKPSRLSPDGRSASWRVRVRLFPAGSTYSRLVDPVADTDPELPRDALTGSATITGLPAVAEYVADLASHYHGAPCVGLDGPAMRHKLKGLRPTISRRGGNATWRLHYRSCGREWLACVDVVRVET